MFSFLFCSHISVFISIFCFSIYFTCISVLYFPAWRYSVQTKYFLFLSITTSPNKCSLEGSVFLSFVGSPSVTLSSVACCAMYCLKLVGLSCDFGWTVVMTYTFPFDAIIVFFSTEIQTWICCAQRVSHHSHYVFTQKFIYCWEASSVSVKSVAFYDDSKLEEDQFFFLPCVFKIQFNIILLSLSICSKWHLSFRGFSQKPFVHFIFSPFVKHHTCLSHHSAL